MKKRNENLAVAERRRKRALVSRAKTKLTMLEKHNKPRSRPKRSSNALSGGSPESGGHK